MTIHLLWTPIQYKANGGDDNLDGSGDYDSCRRDFNLCHFIICLFFSLFKCALLLLSDSRLSSVPGGCLAQMRVLYLVDGSTTSFFFVNSKYLTIKLNKYLSCFFQNFIFRSSCSTRVVYSSSAWHYMCPQLASYSHKRWRWRDNWLAHCLLCKCQYFWNITEDQASGLFI